MEKSAPIQPESPHSGVYRETFLSILDKDEAETFRAHGLILENRFLDRSAFDAPTTSFTESEIRGALLDLRFLAEFLRAVGREREASELPPRDWQLSYAAAEVAEHVGALALRLDGELKRLSESGAYSEVVER